MQICCIWDQRHVGESQSGYSGFLWPLKQLEGEYISLYGFYTELSNVHGQKLYYTIHVCVMSMHLTQSDHVLHWHHWLLCYSGNITVMKGPVFTTSLSRSAPPISTIASWAIVAIHPNNENCHCQWTFIVIILIQK